MRSIGLVLALIGGFVVYLGYKGKTGAAWSALRLGSVTPANADYQNNPPQRSYSGGR